MPNFRAIDLFPWRRVMRYINPLAIPAPNMPGWYSLPDFPDYAISEDGQIWSYHRNKFRVPFENSGGYLQITLHNKGRSMLFMVHRLVGWIFIKLPKEFNKDYSTATINHIDHNKKNNHYTNLEWVTASYNSQEAWFGGWLDHLRFRCFIIDVEKRSRTEFKSTIEASKYLGKQDNAIHTVITRSSGLYLGKYICGLMDDPTWIERFKKLTIDEIIELYQDEIDDYKWSGPKPCFVIDVQNRERVDFENGLSASKHFKFPDTAIHQAIANSNGIYYGKYICGYLDDPVWEDRLKKLTTDEIIELYKDKIENFRSTVPKQCFVIDVEAKKKRDFNSTAEASRAFGFPDGAVKSTVNRDSDILYGKYIVGYSDDPIWQDRFDNFTVEEIIEMFREEIENYSGTKACFVINMTTKERYYFESGLKADEYFGFGHSCVNNAIRYQNGVIKAKYVAGFLDDKLWQFRFRSFKDKDYDEYFRKLISTYNIKKSGPKIITNLETGESKKYSSLSEFAREKGLDPSNIGRILKRNKSLYKVEPAERDK